MMKRNLNMKLVWGKLLGLGLGLWLPAMAQAQFTFTTNNGAITITGGTTFIAINNNIGTYWR